MLATEIEQYVKAGRKPFEVMACLSQQELISTVVKNCFHSSTPKNILPQTNLAGNLRINGVKRKYEESVQDGACFSAKKCRREDNSLLKEALDAIPFSEEDSEIIEIALEMEEEENKQFLEGILDIEDEYGVQGTRFSSIDDIVKYLKKGNVTGASYQLRARRDNSDCKKCIGCSR
ncbi:MAG: hypothetical protein QWI36_01175 [Wolbachia endosymbiont of Tyrophagus putrescentiae]|nr:hypothetical protein [Wolbachia endosymbiont of Tyrophagus putrescentiae]